MYCVYCGREIMDNMAFCDKCGKPVRKIQSDEANSDVCSSTEQIINDVDPNETYTERPLSLYRQIGVMIFGKGTYNNKILSPQSDGIYCIDFPEIKDSSAQALSIRFKTDNGEWYFAESSDYKISHLRETDNCLNTYIREYGDPKMNEYRLTVRGEHLLTLIIYEPEKYDEVVKGFEYCHEGGERCYRCYRLRLEETAIKAKENNFDYFTTTLSVSPHKNSKWINEIGFMLEDKYDMKFLPSDFKKKNGYKRSIELCEQYCLYRQNYCGCKYSLAERIEQDKKKKKDE